MKGSNKSAKDNKKSPVQQKPAAAASVKKPVAKPAAKPSSKGR
jgi:hypothetical protein